MVQERFAQLDHSLHEVSDKHAQNLRDEINRERMERDAAASLCNERLDALNQNLHDEITNGAKAFAAGPLQEIKARITEGVHARKALEYNFAFMQIGATWPINLLIEKACGQDVSFTRDLADESYKLWRESERWGCEVVKCGSELAEVSSDGVGGPADQG